MDGPFHANMYTMPCETAVTKQGKVICWICDTNILLFKYLESCRVSGVGVLSNNRPGRAANILPVKATDPVGCLKEL
jgi:hypothetical protein